MRRLLGGLLISVPFILFTVYMVVESGPYAAVGTWLVAGALYACIHIGVNLLSGERNDRASL